MLLSPALMNRADAVRPCTMASIPIHLHATAASLAWSSSRTCIHMAPQGTPALQTSVTSSPRWMELSPATVRVYLICLQAVATGSGAPIAGGLAAAVDYSQMYSQCTAIRG